MRQLISILFLTTLALVALVSSAQNPTQPIVIGAPPIGGNCVAGTPIYANLQTGQLTSCQSGVWALVTGSTGGSFVAPYTGAVTRAYNSKMADFISAVDFGADPTGTVDSTAAIQLAANNPLNYAVYLPAGTFLRGGATIVVPSHTTIFGAGRGTTKINDTNATADLFSLTACGHCTISDMSIMSTVSKTSGYAVKSTNSTNLALFNLYIDYMPFGFQFNGGSVIRVDNVDIRDLYPSMGKAIYVTGGAIEVRINGVVSDNASLLQPLCGICIDNSPYVQIDRSEMIRAGTGLLVNPGAGQAVYDLTVNDSLFDSPQSDGIALAPTAGAAIVRAKFNNTWASGSGISTPAAGANGVRMDPSGGAVISGTTFNRCTVIFNRQYGFYLAGGAFTTDTVITNSRVYGNSFAPSVSGTYAGIVIFTTVSGVQIVGNYLGTNDVTYQTQAEGILLSGLSNDYLMITNNMIPGSTFAPIYFNAPSAAVHNRIEMNSPYNPVGPSTLTCSGSPCTLPAVAVPTTSTLYLAGGTVSAVKRNTFTVCAVSPCVVNLPPNGQVVVTYSSVPTTITLDVQ